MTISEIKKHLNDSVQNGIVIRRPHFSKLNIELYLDKENNVWEISVNGKLPVDFMAHELEVLDWEIV